METEFTPLASFGGGALIGAAAILMMLTLGRVFGATGILSGAVLAESREHATWRLAVLAGMVSAPLLIVVLTGRMPVIEVPVSTAMMVGGGLLVGLGVSFGGGCTSGHGVCGIARLSARSIVATVVFMAVTFATVFVIRHVLGG